MRAYPILAAVVTATVAVPLAAQSGPAPRPTPAEYEALWRARQDSARTRFTPADVAFMQGMIHHHAQALVMAALAPANGAGPDVRTLAARITNAQRDEIASMQEWLRLRGQDVPELHEMGGALMVHGPTGHAHGPGHGDAPMAGMLTDAQLDELRAARGEAFDRLFLTYMIQHHNGAVLMVEQLFATDGAGQDLDVFKFASDVQVDQRTEVDRMTLMLSALRPTSTEGR